MMPNQIVLILSRKSEEEQSKAERIQEVCEADDVFGELLRPAAEMRPDCDPEPRGNPVLHP